MKSHLLLYLFSLFVILASAQAADDERLFWHPVRLDDQGKLLSWSDSQSPYNNVITRAWQMFKSIPAQPNGKKTYFAFPVFYSPLDAGKDLFEGRHWTHNPASLFAMLTDAGLLYYAYCGDEEIPVLIGEMLDHFIEHGSTKESDAWSLVPYSSADGGSLTYRGATDTHYQQDERFLGRGDGVGFLEPDKVGELGLAYLRFYMFTLDQKYLDAAAHCADALARHVRQADQSHSPWPFRVDALTGKDFREDYTANTVGPIRLLDEMIRLKLGNTDAYERARKMAFEWLMAYPVRNNIWTQYFEDIYIYPDYRTNLTQYCPLETARYLMENPHLDPDWRRNVRSMLEWTRGFFTQDSVTMAGLPEKGIQWHADVISEQVNDMDKMTSHTARYASVWALWYEKTGDAAALERAFRSFNWASYGCREDGLVKTSLDEGTGYWFSDGYGDYMRHFQRGIASVPQWAPSDQNHMLRSSSIVRSIKYSPGRIVYFTFGKTGHELFKLTVSPRRITVGESVVQETETLAEKTNCYTVEKTQDKCYLVNIHHQTNLPIIIDLK